MSTSLRSSCAQAFSSGLVALIERISPSGTPMLRSYSTNASKGLVVTTPPKSHSTALIATAADRRGIGERPQISSPLIRLARQPIGSSVPPLLNILNKRLTTEFARTIIEPSKEDL